MVRLLIEERYTWPVRTVLLGGGGLRATSYQITLKRPSFTDAHHSCLPLAQAGQQTHWMKKMTGAAVQNRAVPSQACGPREPHPRQVDILLDNGMPVTCKMQW